MFDPDFYTCRLKFVETSPVWTLRLAKTHLSDSEGFGEILNNDNNGEGLEVRTQEEPTVT